MSSQKINYKAIVDTIPIVTYVVHNDDNFTIQFMSDAVESLTGYAKEKFQSNNFFRGLIHDEDQPRIFLEVEEAIKTLKPYSFNYRLKMFDGTYKWVKEHGKAVEDDEGEITHFVGMIWDIDDLMTAKSDVFHREEYIQAILKATELLFSKSDYRQVIDRCFEILGNVQKVHRIYFYENSTLEGKHVTSLKHEWVAEGITPYITNPNQQNIPHELMMEFFKPLYKNETFESMVEDLPESDLKEHLLEQDIVSIIVIPIYINNHFFGFIGFDDNEKKRTFTPLEKQLLLSFSKSIESAIERYQSIESVHEKSHVLHTVFEAIEEGVALVDKDYTIVMINDAMKRYLVKPYFEGMKCFDLFEGKSHDCDPCIIQKTLSTGDVESFKYHFDLDEISKILEIFSYPVKDQHQKVTGVVLKFSDITEKEKIHTKLKTLSETDPLTKLYNRAYFENYLEKLRSDQHFHIFSLDVDGLKIINDTLGHQKGDELLLKVTSILKRYTNEDALLARIGGDEFVVLMKGLSKRKANDYYEKLVNAFEKQNHEPNHLYLSVSIGIAYSKDHNTPYEALKHADEVMYSQKLRKGQEAKNKIVQTLFSHLKTQSKVTRNHENRFISHVTKLSEKLGLPPSKIPQMKTLAEVHDIGKIGIPDYILLKPTKLTKDEWKVMKSHSEKGYRITSNSPELAMISEYILKHHEHYDGSGYPLELQGEEIPIESRILLVCDAFDAMTSDRPYRKALSEEKAINELLKHRGTHFDPKIVDTFINEVI